MKGKDQPAGAEGVEKLEQHHRHHGPRLRQVDRGVTEIAPMPNQFPGQLDLAPQVVRTFERKPTETKRPVGALNGRGGGLGPDLDVVAQTGAGAGDFLGKRRDAAPHGIKFVRDQEDGPIARGGGGG